MAKIKLTKGELKKQRDTLRQYERYLPTLQLKKQQLQAEILHQHNLLSEKKTLLEKKRNAVLAWAGLLGEGNVIQKEWLISEKTVASARNIAGVELPVFSEMAFAQPDYDLFLLPLWVDNGLEALRAIVALEAEIVFIERGIEALKRELRITTQRVNLFEKIKIPEAQEAIRVIKIYIGDQMANAVGRCKIAKRKIEQAQMLEVAA
ncbi:MAG: V-type ATP synthase subunit D [Candidatus Omnitrophota bacterium]|nr:V-type ATP synthase subunit D [Candidatus Omnitrophota bacterium]